MAWTSALTKTALGRSLLVEQAQAGLVATLTTERRAHHHTRPTAGSSVRLGPAAFPAVDRRIGRVAHDHGHRRVAVDIDQVIHHPCGPGRGVGADGGVAVQRRLCVEDHDRQLPPTARELADPPQPRGPGQQQPVDLSVAQIEHAALLDDRVEAGVGDQHRVAEIGRRSLDLPRVLGEEGVGAVGHDQTDRLGAPDRQRPRGGVRAVAQPVDGVPDAGRRRLRHRTRPAVDDVADHGGAHPREPCDVGAGGAGASYDRVVLCHREPPLRCAPLEKTARYPRNRTRREVIRECFSTWGLRLDPLILRG